MPNTEERTTRLSFDIPTELHDRLSRYLSWGNRGWMLKLMVELMVEALDKAGKDGDAHRIIGAMISRDFNPFSQMRRQGEGRGGQDGDDV